MLGLFKTIIHTQKLKKDTTDFVAGSFIVDLVAVGADFTVATSISEGVSFPGFI